MKGYYTLKPAAGGKFMFTLHAGNHQIILTSQLYADRSGAENGIASVRKNGANDASFDRKQAKSGQPYFSLMASNGQIIGSSEMYESAAACEKGIKSVMANSPSEKVKDITRIA